MAKIIKLEEYPYRELKDANGVQWASEYVIGKEIGVKNLSVCVISKKPGLNPLSVVHYHPRREEIFIILEGRAKAIVNDAEIILEPGMVVFVPAGEKHFLNLRAVPMGDKVFKMIEAGSPGGGEGEEVFVGDRSRSIWKELFESSVVHRPS